MSSISNNISSNYPLNQQLSTLGVSSLTPMQLPPRQSPSINQIATPDIYVTPDQEQHIDSNVSNKFEYYSQNCF
jgi:hypothetical protein